MYNDNKTDLFYFLADKIVERCQGTVVREEGVVSSQLISLEGMAPCNHEEADSRLFLHARHAVEQGHTSLIIKACDTDVQKLWVAFGLGSNLRWIPIYDTRRSIGNVKSKGIPFFHAFTGCDVVSAFH